MFTQIHEIEGHSLRFQVNSGCFFSVLYDLRSYLSRIFSKSRRTTAREELLNLLHVGRGGFEDVIGFGHVDQRCCLAGYCGGIHSGSKGGAAITATAEEESLRGWGCGWVLGSADWEIGGGLQVGLGSGF
ncbi:hypothetical protein L3X38_003930 [Prunus dulcis]|uniref:Uncharacterized protein n=1 Tax=Prunus dulcis TaxID=3755 RepID=A0AAD4ZN19_PRUDU|nr:hypothetical protein L3X38_003930 [Prunus dulcis]